MESEKLEMGQWGRRERCLRWGDRRIWVTRKQSWRTARVERAKQGGGRRRMASGSAKMTLKAYQENYALPTQRKIN